MNFPKNWKWRLWKISMLPFPLHLTDIQIVIPVLTPLFEAQQVPLLALIMQRKLFFE